jgi:hypothetical protein
VAKVSIAPRRLKLVVVDSTNSVERNSMHTVVGPVLTRKGGYAFDCWTPEKGLSPGYTYHRIQDALYARNVEIRSHNKGSEDHGRRLCAIYHGRLARQACPPLTCRTLGAAGTRPRRRDSTNAIIPSIALRPRCSRQDDLCHIGESPLTSSPVGLIAVAGISGIGTHLPLLGRSMRRIASQRTFEEGASACLTDVF